MTINKDDIKVYAAQRLTGEDDGGGRATGEVVIDSQVNNLFRDISLINRSVGRGPLLRSANPERECPGR